MDCHVSRETFHNQNPERGGDWKIADYLPYLKFKWINSTEKLGRIFDNYTAYCS
jgi:hypothetical protein